MDKLKEWCESLSPVGGNERLKEKPSFSISNKKNKKLPHSSTALSPLPEPP